MSPRGEERLLRLGRRIVPHRIAVPVKRLVAAPRFLLQMRKARAGFREFGDRYPNNLLFVAGLPKSGTTWLARLLAEYPGFCTVMPTPAVRFELTYGESCDYLLPADLTSLYRGALVVLKLHVAGSEHNADVLERSRLPYVLLFRDLRDVAVSYVFYVRSTPWHPENHRYARLGISEGLRTFADLRLDQYSAWIRSWRKRIHPILGLELKYEEMLADIRGALTRTAAHYGLDSSPEWIEKISARHDFTRITGRLAGVSGDLSLFRKGVQGDWRNHFTPALDRLYRRQAGELLDELGYQ